MNNKFEDILLPKKTILITPITDYYKAPSGKFDTSTAQDRNYNVGIIEKVSADIDDSIVGAEVFYIARNNPDMLEIKGLGTYEQVRKDSILLIDTRNITNSNTKNDGQKS